MEITCDQSTTIVKLHPEESSRVRPDPELKVAQPEGDRNPITLVRLLTTQIKKEDDTQEQK